LGNGKPDSFVVGTGERFQLENNRLGLFGSSLRDDANGSANRDVSTSFGQENHGTI
jgi:hypothetical protein